MSFINTPALRRLWQDAQAYPEWATTRMWEYVLNRMAFVGESWLVSSQQPPTHTPGDLRRVDLIVELMDSASDTAVTLLFIEAKRASASPNDIAEVEMQAYTAACAYAVDSGSTDPVWTMTCVGSLFRLWIFDWDQSFLVPYFPATHGIAEKPEYIELSERGAELLQHLNYIKKHPKPPKRLLGQASPRPTNATLPPDWHDQEVIFRDSQHQGSGHDAGHGSGTADLLAAGGTYDADMTDAGLQEPGYNNNMPAFPPTWYAPPAASTAGRLVPGEAEMTDAGHQWDYSSASWHPTQTTSTAGGTAPEEMPPPSDEHGAGENRQGTASPLSMPGAVGELGQDSTQDTCYDNTQGIYYGDEAERSTAVGNTDAQGVKTWSKTDLYRIRHMTRRDEYVFTTDRGTEKSTDRDAWTEIRYKGKRAWYYRYKGIYYYTREKP